MDCLAGAAWAAWADRATAAAAVAGSTGTRVRLACVGRRRDATRASSFCLQPPAACVGNEMFPGPECRRPPSYARHFRSAGPPPPSGLDDRLAEARATTLVTIL